MTGIKKGNGRIPICINIDQVVASQIREKYPGKMSDLVNKCIFEYFKLKNGDTLIQCPNCKSKFAFSAQL